MVPANYALLTEQDNEEVLALAAIYWPAWLFAYSRLPASSLGAIKDSEPSW